MNKIKVEYNMIYFKVRQILRKNEIINYHMNYVINDVINDRMSSK